MFSTGRCILNTITGSKDNKTNLETRLTIPFTIKTADPLPGLIPFLFIMYILNGSPPTPAGVILAKNIPERDIAIEFLTERITSFIILVMEINLRTSKNITPKEAPRANKK